MYLVFYPTGYQYERHSFDNLDWSVPEEAKEVFKQLYSVCHNDYNFHFFNISSIERSIRHFNLDDFVEMCNNEEVGVERCCAVWLNLTEADVLSVIEEYETDRINTVGNGDEYYILTENIELVDYPEEDFLLSYFDKVEAISELDKDERLLLVKSAENENGVLTHSVFDCEGIHCFGSFSRMPALNDEFDDLFRKFIEKNRDEIKKWYGI